MKRPSKSLDSAALEEWAEIYTPELFSAWETGPSDIMDFWDWLDLECTDEFTRFEEWFAEGEEDVADNAYGLYIDIDTPSLQAMKDALMRPAHKKVEVAVRYRGQTREFGFAEFFERLGFTETEEKA